MADFVRTIQRVPINTLGGAPGTPIQLAAGLADYRILVVALSLSADAAVQITLRDTTPTAYYNAMLNGALNCLLPESEKGWALLGSGLALELLVNAPVRVVGTLLYRMIPDHLEL